MSDTLRERIADDLMGLIAEDDDAPICPTDCADMQMTVGDLRRILTTLTVRTASPSPTEHWQPIESAPKDGSDILISGVGSRRWIDVGRWYKGGWRNDGFGTISGVTHWQPLPEPPTDG